MKQPIRYFSIGMLLATIIMFVTFILSDSDQTVRGEDQTIEAMIERIENEGYHILTASEYISYAVSLDQNNTNDHENNEQSSEANDEDHDEGNNNSEETVNNENNEVEDNNDAEENEDRDEMDDEESVHIYTLTIESGMLGPEVSQLLVDNQIIDDAEEFNRYLEVEGYAPYIQIGDHELSSDMTFYQIAETIARLP